LILEIIEFYPLIYRYSMRGGWVFLHTTCRRNP